MHRQRCNEWEQCIRCSNLSHQLMQESCSLAGAMEHLYNQLYPCSHFLSASTLSLLCSHLTDIQAYFQIGNSHRIRLDGCTKEDFGNWSGTLLWEWLWSPEKLWGWLLDQILFKEQLDWLFSLSNFQFIIHCSGRERDWKSLCKLASSLYNLLWEWMLTGRWFEEDWSQCWTSLIPLGTPAQPVSHWRPTCVPHPTHTQICFKISTNIFHNSYKYVNKLQNTLSKFSKIHLTFTQIYAWIPLETPSCRHACICTSSKLLLVINQWSWIICKIYVGKEHCRMLSLPTIKHNFLDTYIIFLSIINWQFVKDLDWVTTLQFFCAFIVEEKPLECSQIHHKIELTFDDLGTLHIFQSKWNWPLMMEILRWNWPGKGRSQNWSCTGSS